MKWSFPSNNNGDVNGIGNSGIETFQGTPLKSLAREICQNSLDAALDGKTVEVEFTLFYLPGERFPDREKLKEAVERSIEFWKDNKKTTDFFEEAIRILSEPTIPFLRISDYNTTGLTGSHGVYNTPWCNLTKSSGASDKAGSAGGSFGIGKFAPYACSKVRTVFYSTNDIEDVSAYQGISRITSFKDACGEITTGVGYYGQDGNEPVFEQISLQDGFVRSENQTGTDIYIAGFRESNDWETDIIAAVLDGFLYAVYARRLVVRVGNVVIDADNLENLCEYYKEYFTENADKYYNVLATTTSRDIEFRNMGKVRLWIAIKSECADMPRKVAMVRKTGMKILDKSGISGSIPFAGLMLFEGDLINEFLRSLENPEHRQWQPDRCAYGRLYAQNVIRDLVKIIKDALEELQPEDDKDEIDPLVGDYLPDETDVEDKTGAQLEDVISDNVKEIERRPQKPRRRNGSTDLNNDDTAPKADENGERAVDESSGAGHNDGKGGGGGSGIGNGDGDGIGPNPKPQKMNIVGIRPLKARIWCLDKNKGEYSIAFVPSVSAENGYIELYLVAESQNYPAQIISVSGLGQKGLVVDAHRIKNITFEENKPVRMKVSIAFSDYCSMEVKAYGNKR